MVFAAHRHGVEQLQSLRIGVIAINTCFLGIPCFCTALCQSRVCGSCCGSIGGVSLCRCIRCFLQPCLRRCRRGCC